MSSCIMVESLPWSVEEVGTDEEKDYERWRGRGRDEKER